MTKQKKHTINIVHQNKYTKGYTMLEFGEFKKIIAQIGNCNVDNIKIDSLLMEDLELDGLDIDFIIEYLEEKYSIKIMGEKFILLNKDEMLYNIFEERIMVSEIIRFVNDKISK